MKTLLVLRHAKSSWKDPALSDHDRPLNKRGKRDAPRMGHLLVREGLVPDLIISSSAVRAVTTTESVALACNYESQIKYTRHLYHAWPASYLEVLREIPNDYQRVMVVGHNPGMEELVEEVTGEWVRMPTAALAQISLDIDRWSDLSFDDIAPLIHVWRPKEMS